MESYANPSGAEIFQNNNNNSGNSEAYIGIYVLYRKGQPLGVIYGGFRK